MALSDKQKTRILFYLGWSGLTLVPESTHFNSVVSDRINDSAAIPSICCIIKELLDKLESTDADLDSARCRLTASKVDNITLNEKEIPMLKKERLRCIRELADLLNVPITRTGMGTLGVCV